HLASTLALGLALPGLLALALTLGLPLALPRTLLGPGDTQATDTGDREEYCDREPCPALADAMHFAPSPVSGRNPQPILDQGGGQDAGPVFWRIGTDYRQILPLLQAMRQLAQRYGTSSAAAFPASTSQLYLRYGRSRSGRSRVRRCRQGQRRDLHRPDEHDSRADRDPIGDVRHQGVRLDPATLLGRPP